MGICIINAWIRNCRPLHLRVCIIAQAGIPNAVVKSRNFLAKCCEMILLVVFLLIVSILPCYQLSPPENKTFIFQLWSHILKAFHCVSVLSAVEIVLPCLLDFGQVMCI